MRIIHTIIQDIKFQFRYGFYFIYTVMVLFYIVLIGFLPEAWRSNATAIALFSDPAALGFFFIGGILLLEKGEKVLDVLFVSPLEVWEYILAKAASLALISVLAGVIIAVVGLGAKVNIPVLMFSLLIGSILFTFVGVAAGVKARTVNQFMIITIPAETLLSAPPIILLFGVKSIFLEIMPGSLVLRLFQWCTGTYSAASPVLMLIGLLLWTLPAFYLANRRMKWFLSKIGGEAYETGSKTA
jgi:fluoroquinolone transport system permease protein